MEYLNSPSLEISCRWKMSLLNIYVLSIIDGSGFSDHSLSSCMCVSHNLNYCRTFHLYTVLVRAWPIVRVCVLTPMLLHSRAELHGEEMLSHISKLLSVDTGDPLHVVMAIEGLVALCQSEVMDVGTLWGVLDAQHYSRTLLQDTRSVGSPFGVLLYLVG